jgi:hypothetical protein
MTNAELERLAEWVYGQMRTGTLAEARTGKWDKRFDAKDAEIIARALAPLIDATRAVCTISCPEEHGCINEAKQLLGPALSQMGVTND